MRKLLLLLILMLSTLSVEAQVNSSKSGFTVLLSGNFVSSATIELSPFSSDLIERNMYMETKGGYGYGLSVKKRFFRDDLSIGISSEYIKINDDELISTLFIDDSTYQRFRVGEKLTMIPVELSLYFDVPSFTEGLNIYLGGGVGAYFGDRIRTIRNESSETITRKAGINFHILSGIEYFFDDTFAAVLEMKFRQAGYSVKSRLDVLQGTPVNPTGELDSRIFLDGLKISLGISAHL